MDTEKEIQEMKALMAFAKKAPEGKKDIVGGQQHIDYVLNFNDQPLAAIIIIDKQPTLSQLATLQAYKNGRGYKFGYLIWYTEAHVFYQELNHIEATIQNGLVNVPASSWKMADIQ
jgi:hypothetical protein